MVLSFPRGKSQLKLAAIRVPAWCGRDATRAPFLQKTHTCTEGLSEEFRRKKSIEGRQQEK